MKKRKMILVMMTALMILSGCTQSSSHRDEKQTEEVSQIEKGNHMDFKQFDELPQKIYIDNSVVSFTANVPRSGARPRSFGYGTSIEEDAFIMFDWFMMMGSEDKYGYKKEDFQDARDIVPKMKDQILLLMFSYGESWNSKDNLVIESEENITVNGYDFVKTKAYAEMKADAGYKDNRINLVIYGLIKDGYPMYIAGVDQTNEQNKMATVEKYTYMVIQTFREYEDK